MPGQLQSPGGLQQGCTGGPRSRIWPCSQSLTRTSGSCIPKRSERISGLWSAQIWIAARKGESPLPNYAPVSCSTPLIYALSSLSSHPPTIQKPAVGIRRKPLSRLDW
ncbi:unnamed protein product [Lepidochelys kempii]